MAVTPAGAEVSNAVATSWKKIWKKNLKPLADKRYYTKKQSDTKYSVAGSGYTKTESDTKYQAKGSYETAGSGYTKAETDAKFAPAQPLYRGMWFFSAGPNAYATASISFGASFPSQPTVHYIPAGAVLPVGCSGTVAAPNAAPGHLCIFENSTNIPGAVSIVRSNLTAGAEVFGANMYASTGASIGEGLGTWAARPTGPVTNPGFTAPSSGARNGVAGGSRSGIAGAGN